MSRGISHVSEHLDEAIKEVWFFQYSQGFLSPQLMLQAHTTVSGLSDEVRGELREIELLIEKDRGTDLQQAENQVDSGEGKLVPSNGTVSHVDAARTLAVVTLAEYFVDRLLQLPKEAREKSLQTAAETVGVPVERLREAILRWRSVRRRFLPGSEG